MQAPPLYSALKRAGKPLYAYARAASTSSARTAPGHDPRAGLLQWFYGDRLGLVRELQQGHLYPLARARHWASASVAVRILPPCGVTAVGSFRSGLAHTLKACWRCSDERATPDCSCRWMPCCRTCRSAPGLRAAGAVPAGQAVHWRGPPQARARLWQRPARSGLGEWGADGDLAQARDCAA